MSLIKIQLDTMGGGNLDEQVTLVERYRDGLKEISDAEKARLAIARQASKEVSEAAKAETEAKHASLKLADLLAKQEAKRLSDEQKKQQALKEESSLIGQVNHRLKEQQQIIKSARTKEELLAANKEVQKLQGELRELNNLGKQTTNTFSEAAQSFQAKFNTIGNIVGGAALAAGAGALSLISEAGDYVVETIAEMNAKFKETSAVTGLAGKSLLDLTAGLTATSRSFDVGYTESLRAANVLIKTFGLQGREAVDLINSGFVQGANINDEYLDSLREYAPQFKAAGLSAKEFNAVLIAGANQGIFSDKAPDTIKEAGLRLREQTTAVKDALKKAFGDGFTKDLLGAVNKGSITTFGAIQKVSQALKDTQLTASQTQTVIADVFGSPGEDAGLGFITSLADIKLEFQSLEQIVNDTSGAFSAYQKNQAEIVLLNQELAQSQSIFAAQLSTSGQTFETIGLKIKKFFFDVMASGLHKIQLGFIDLQATWAGLKDITNFNTAFAKKQADLLADYYKRFVDNQKDLAKEAEDTVKKASLGVDPDAEKAAKEAAKKREEEYQKSLTEIKAKYLKQEQQIRSDYNVSALYDEATFNKKLINLEDNRLREEIKLNEKYGKLTEEQQIKIGENIAKRRKAIDEALIRNRNESQTVQLQINSSGFAERELILSELLRDEALTEERFLKLKFDNRQEFLKKEIELRKRFGGDTLQLEQQLVDAQIAENKRLKAEKDKGVKELLDSTSQLLSKIEALQEKASQQRIDSIERQLTAQEDAINTQRELAAKGLDNTLKFELERQQKLEAMRAAEEERQRKRAQRMLLLQTILQAVGGGASSSSNISGILGKIGAFREGGIAGEASMYRDGLGGSLRNGVLQGRSHASGGILIEAERSEGILSSKEMSVLGRSGFYALKDALASGVDLQDMLSGGNRQLSVVAKPKKKQNEMLVEIKRLTKVIESKPSLEAVQLDELNNLVATVSQSGNKKRITYARKSTGWR